MHIRTTLVLAAAAAAVVLVTPGHAATVFIGIDNGFMPAPASNSDAARASFLAAAGPVVTEDFESTPIGDLGAVTVGTFAGGIGVTTVNTVTSVGSTAGSYFRIQAGPSSFDTYPTSGRRFLDALSGPDSTYFTSTYDVLLGALGFSYTDVSDWAGSGGQIEPLNMLVTFGDGSTQEIDLTAGNAPTSLGNGNLGFVGIVETTLGIRSIAIRSANAPDGDALGIDDVMVARLPEPTPAALLALAAAGFALSRRRTRPDAPCRSSRRG